MTPGTWSDPCAPMHRSWTRPRELHLAAFVATRKLQTFSNFAWFCQVRVFLGILWQHCHGVGASGYPTCHGDPRKLNSNVWLQCVGSVGVALVVFWCFWWSCNSWHAFVGTVVGFLCLSQRDHISQASWRLLTSALMHWIHGHPWVHGSFPMAGWIRRIIIFIHWFLWDGLGVPRCVVCCCIQLCSRYVAGLFLPVCGSCMHVFLTRRFLHAMWIYVICPMWFLMFRCKLLTGSCLKVIITRWHIKVTSLVLICHVECRDSSFRIKSLQGLCPAWSVAEGSMYTGPVFSQNFFWLMFRFFTEWSLVHITVLVVAFWADLVEQTQQSRSIRTKIYPNC